MTALAAAPSTAPALQTPSPPPRRVPSAAAQLTPPERVAVVLSLLEPEAARTLAGRLEPQAVDAVVDAYERLGTLPRPVILEVIAGFVATLSSPHPTVRGGPRQAKALADALSPDEPAKTDEAEAAETPSSIGEGAEPDAVWAHLSKMTPDELARLVEGERASVVAALLSRLPQARGGPVLAALPEPLAVAAGGHMAGGGPLAGATLDAIAEALRVQAGAPPAEDGEEGQAGPLTALLNRCPLSRQEAVLAPLRERAPETAARIEDGLLRFASLPERLPRLAAPILFREAEQDVLDTALRYAGEAAPEVTEFLYANISQRLAEQIRERVAGRALPSPEDGEAAQAKLIGSLLEWVAADRFALTEPED